MYNKVNIINVSKVVESAIVFENVLCFLQTRTPLDKFIRKRNLALLAVATPI